MRGDESGLGTPEEDLTSVAALAGTEGPERLVVSIENTHLMRQVSSAIEVFREEVRQRPPRRIPH
ncbi:hypothetical protein ABZ362_13355 [Streptomyces sp. NPDC005951]|uniref:hypothetical protein n=1 Tax=Streptomyces sp. NPDC005951 TaxID=3154573 RepID=UPI0033E5387A